MHVNYFVQYDQTANQMEEIATKKRNIVIRVVNKNLKMNLLIVRHTDSIVTEKYNQQLSGKRTHAIKKALGST